MTARGLRPGPLVLQALLAVLLGLVPAGGASAQGWVVDLQAGRADFQTVPTATSTTNASLGLRFTEDHRLFQISVAGPLGSDELFWGMVGASDRFAHRRGRFEVGLDLLGQAHFQRDGAADISGRSLRGDLMPMASASAGPVVLEGRSGASYYRAETADQTWSRELWASDIRLVLAPAPHYRISADSRHARNRNEAYTFVGGSAHGVVNGILVWASVGEWVSGLEPEMPSTSWGLGGSVFVLPQVAVWASVRRDPFEPLFLATSRTSWGLGVSYRLGAARSGPSPAGPEIRDRGRTVLRLPLSEASSPPWVAGDFTGWEPVRMHRHGGHWRLDVDLEPGVYHYSFRDSDGEWFVPETVPGRRDDGMGGWVAVLIVP